MIRTLKCGALKQRKCLIFFSIQVRLDGLALTLAAYLEEAEVKLPPVSIRLTTSVQLTKEDIFDAARKLDEASRIIFKELDSLLKQDDA